MNTLDDDLVELCLHLDAEMSALEAEAALEHTTQVWRRSTPAVASMVAAAVLVAVGVTAVAIDRRDQGRAPVAESAPAPTASATSDERSAPVAESSPVPTASATSCDAGATEIELPNVAGMSYRDAAAELTRLGASPQPLLELTPWGTTTDAEPVVQQRTPPCTTVSCGTQVQLVVAFQPGPLHVVQPGDTLASIAAAADLTVDQLIAYNGVDSDAYVVPGLAVRLTAHPGPPPTT